MRTYAWLLFKVLLATFGVGCVCGAAWAFDVQEAAKLVAPDAAALDRFGDAIAVDGDTAIIGAPTADSGAQDAGAAYVFVRVGDQWSVQAKLVSPSPMVNGYFGWAVAVRGNVAMVGSPSARAVYVFKRTGGLWELSQTLVGDELQYQFGASVSLAIASVADSDGSIAYIGAPYALSAGPGYAGAAFVYTRDANGTWSLAQRLTAIDAAADDRFGHAVASTGGRVIVGAPWDDDLGENSGSAYVFARVGTTNNWTQVAKLTANDGLPQDNYGGSVATDLSMAVVGSSRSGAAAYVYSYTRVSASGSLVDNYAQVAKLVPDTPPQSGTYSVAAQGSVVLVGAANDSQSFLFRRDVNGWEQVATLTPSVGGLFFGGKVAMDDTTVMVGAIGDDHAGQLSGSAFAFSIGPSTDPALVVDTGPGTLAFGAVLNGPDTGEPTFAGSEQRLAGLVTLDATETVRSVLGWMYPFKNRNGLRYLGTVKAAIHANTNGDVGAEIYSATFELACAPDNCDLATWQGPSGLNWPLEAGQYWVVFSMPSGSPAFATMPGYVLFPLEQYKFYVVYNGGAWNTSLYAPFQWLGMRLIGSRSYGTLSLSLNQATVAGCRSVTGTVTLSQPAPAGGARVALSDTLPAATTPASVTIPAGATSASFQVTTSPVAYTQSGTVSAKLAGNTVSQPLTLRPMGLASLRLDPLSVVGSRPVTGQVQLECAAGPGPIVVSLASSDPTLANVASPSVVIPQGVQSVSFGVTTSVVSNQKTVQIVGRANGTQRARGLTLNPPLSADTTRLSFGKVRIDTNSSEVTVTITNGSAYPATLVSVYRIGQDFAGSVGANYLYTCGTVGPGDTCTVKVRVIPQSGTGKFVVTDGLRFLIDSTYQEIQLSLRGTVVP